LRCLVEPVVFDFRELEIAAGEVSRDGLAKLASVFALEITNDKPVDPV